MVSSPEVQAAAPSPGIQLLGSVQVIGQISHPEGRHAARINDCPLYELIHMLIPPDFQGKASVSINVVAILDPPQNLSPE